MKIKFARIDSKLKNKSKKVDYEFLVHYKGCSQKIFNLCDHYETYKSNSEAIREFLKDHPKINTEEVLSIRLTTVKTYSEIFYFDNDI